MVKMPVRARSSCSVRDPTRFGVGWLSGIPGERQTGMKMSLSEGSSLMDTIEGR